MKYVSLVSISAVATTVLLGSSAYAATTGTITNTGPGSNNTITVNEDCSAIITNTNTISITGSNSQTSSSGSTTSGGNTTGGSATSGSSTNSNSYTVDLNIHNATPEVCVKPTVTPEENGGQVGGTSTTVGGRGGAQIAANQVQAPVGGVAAGAGGLTYGILSTSMLSGGYGLYRLRKQRQQ